MINPASSRCQVHGGSPMESGACSRAQRLDGDGNPFAVTVHGLPPATAHEISLMT